jgi:acetyltransferase-like isoleucine patch superfamily enzyme
MASLLRSIFERLKHASVRRHGVRVSVAPSTRLLRRFSVRFLARPDDRLYLRIGENCLVNAAVTFESKDGLVEIGDRTYIGNDTHLISRSRITIGSDVTMAWGITIYDHNSHSLDWRQRQRVVAHFLNRYGSPACFDELDWSDVRSAPIVIGDRVWIGFGAVILKGVTIGEGAVVGACSVVSRDVEPYTVVAGNPAVLLRRLEPSARTNPPAENDHH